jgi:protein-disulfide isomerase
MRSLGIAAICIGLTFGQAFAQDVFEGLGHVEGRPDAPIQIIEFAEYSCPFCARFSHETLPALHREWIGTGRASIRFIPFHNPWYKPGRDAARAAECAAEQGKFHAMHDLIFERQSAWLSRRGQRERFEAWAVELGLDPAAFRQCWEADPSEERMERNTKAARQHGVRATPTFFIGSRKIDGALTLDQLRILLEEKEAGTI